MTFDFKNATTTQLKAEYQRIAEMTGDNKLFTRKEFNHLPKILAPAEGVLGFASGAMDGHTWLIVLTDRRVLFLDKGLIYGLTQVSIDLSKINAVTGETGLLFGKISIEDGARERTISMVPKQTVVPFTNLVRDAVAKCARPTHATMASHHSSPGESIVSQLERLALLKDKGALTDEEFAQEKARLLASVS